MSRTISKILVGLAGVILLIAVILVLFGIFTVRRSFPKTDGEIKLNSPEAPIDIYRDSSGIPHIYASTQHDLFYAQGYVHAQDRFWQMDFWRHIGSGRLAELLGESQVDTDRFLRTLGWARVVERELQEMDENSMAILQAYADGVNAYLEDHSGSALSLEYAVLKLLNPSYQVEPWKPLHSLTWAKVMAWDLGGNMDSEIERAALLNMFTPEQVAELAPPYSPDAPVIVPDPNTSAQEWNRPRYETAALQDDRILDALADLSGQVESLEALLGVRGMGIGSNSWTISGELTETGMPLLANDPHLSAQMPSIWYQVALHCTPKGPDCPYNVAGFSFAGAPGVIIGHNDRIAWGLTNINPDVQDLYIEKINPQNPNQYEVNGEWVDMTLVEESIQVAGDESVPITVRYTRHGPVVSDTYGDLEEFDQVSGMELPEHYAISLRWTALEPGNIFGAIWKFNAAENWEQFREGAALFAAPAQNIVYADVDGNIGYQMPGVIPIRNSGDGSLPVPGWTDEYEWIDTIPFDELPFAFNPPQGYVVTANNAVVGPDYEYLLSKEWAYGYRARRIVELVENATGPIDISYNQRIQGDNKNLNAANLVPVLGGIEFDDERLVELRTMLEDWDYQQPMDSPEAALFETFWSALLAETFHDDLPEDYWPGGGARWYQVVENILQDPDSDWWDDKRTPEVEGRDEIFRRAFEIAVDWLEGLQGEDPDRWSWGDLHTITFENQSLGKSGVGPVEAIFNRGEFPTAGGAGIVNATGWDANESYAVKSVPSMRMIVDLGDLTNSLTIHTTGQSGHAYHTHYVDMADMWRNIQHLPMLWDREAIEQDAEGHLRLVP